MGNAESAYRTSNPTPIGDPDEAVRFLQQFRGDGASVLTAIKPDVGPVATRTFGPNEVLEATEFIREHAGWCNLHFIVNKPKVRLTKKAARGDIAEILYLHVDIDPRAGEDPAEERARALELLRQCPWPPTVIINSGNGIQAFWRLENPIVINGDLALADYAASYNLALANYFGGDRCHSIDHLMRLPYST